MARSNRTPERSKLVRAKITAFARKDRGAGEGDAPKEANKDDAKPEAKPEAKKEEAKPEASRTDATKDDAGGKPDAEMDRASAETQPIVMKPDPKDLPAITPPDPRDEPWPDATPQPMKPVEPAFASEVPTSTREMPVAAPDLGRPPEMPRSTAPPPLTFGSVEDPTHMPGPKQIPAGNPDDPAPAPGRVPPGDSRSLRHDGEFALIYRVGTCVISRTGRLGTRGQWRVVEYPTSASASNSYAKECSRFVSEGFSDYRE
jgi:hypothetical protein